MTLFGIDVSVYQAGISWHNVAAAGMEYGVARASIGLRVDGTFQSHRTGAQGAGLVAGAYHFLEPGSGSDQADVFMAATNKCHGILAALDCESSGLTIGNIRLFVDRFKSKTGGHPLFIYTGLNFWRLHGNPSIVNLGPLWLAYYVTGGYPGDHDPTWDRIVGGVKPTIWQYGPRPIKGRPPVDGDAFRGTRDELEAFIGPSSTSAPQEDAVVLPIVNDETPRLVDLHVGDKLLDLAGKHLVDVSIGQTQESPWSMRWGGGTYYLVSVTTGGVNTPALLHATAAANARPVPTPVPNCDAAVNAALDHVAATVTASAAAIAEARPR